MRAYNNGLDILGAFDLQVVQRNLNDLKPVTVEIARILVKTGLDTIATAMRAALPQATGLAPYTGELPGGKARDEVLWKLKWHDATLKAKFASAAAFTVYTPGDDLKKWVAQAFVEANAVEVGRELLDRAWNDCWTEIQRELAKIPKAALHAVAQAAGAAASGVVEGATGVPLWAWGVGLTGLLGLVGYGVYRFRSRK